MKTVLITGASTGLGASFARDAGDGGIYQTSGDEAQVALSVLGSDSPPIRLRTSNWCEAFIRLKTQADPTEVKQRDHAVAEMLGDVSKLRKI